MYHIFGIITILIKLKLFFSKAIVYRGAAIMTNIQATFIKNDLFCVYSNLFPPTTCTFSPSSLLIARGFLKTTENSWFRFGSFGKHLYTAEVTKSVYQSMMK